MKIKILKKVWELNFVPFLGKDKDGDCDSPETPNKQIRIGKYLDSDDALRVIIHEVLHGANWHTYSEEYVDELSTDIARILIRLGYKKE